MKDIAVVSDEGWLDEYGVKITYTGVCHKCRAFVSLVDRVESDSLYEYFRRKVEVRG